MARKRPATWAKTTVRLTDATLTAFRGPGAAVVLVLRGTRAPTQRKKGAQ